MGTNRVPAKVTFALEATRACLEQITARGNPSKNWHHFDWSKLSETDSCTRVVIWITVRSSGAKFTSQCDVFRDQHGVLSAQCTIHENSPGGHKVSTFWCYLDSQDNLVAVQDKRYGSVDVDWLETKAREIRSHQLYPRFQEVSPHAARVLEEGGRTYGLSLDAAVTEFEKFASQVNNS